LVFENFLPKILFTLYAIEQNEKLDYYLRKREANSGKPDGKR